MATGAVIAIYAKPGHPQAQALANELRGWLEGRGYRVRVEADGSGDRERAPSLAVVLAGDGTLLHLAPRLAASRTPVLAVHLGTLGFLNETALEALYPALETILAGGGSQERRALLRARLLRRDREAAVYDALNEVVVSKAGLARLVQIELEIGGEHVARYRADGLMVATPTGSTAYSFSAGGPVMHPSLDGWLVTPICPHAQSQRPLVAPGGAVITLKATGAEPTFLTVDGQQGLPLEPGDRLECGRSPLELTLVTAAPAKFYQSLRTKLGWG